MARLAIISDIHANYHALCEVMEDALNREHCNEVVCLGDVIGYNAYPGECLDYIRQLTTHVVKGNHEEEVIAPSSEKMNADARSAMDWTRAHLGSEQMLWISRLQYQRIVRPAGAPPSSTFTIVHSSLSQPKNWGYIFNADDASSNFRQQFAALSFHGHSHVPKVFVWDGRHATEDYDAAHALVMNGYTEICLQPGLKYCVNVGSVGQPRDGDPRACYGIYDTEASIVIIKRVPYDVAAAQQAIYNEGLPESLAERLARGC